MGPEILPAVAIIGAVLILNVGHLGLRDLGVSQIPDVTALWPPNGLFFFHFDFKMSPTFGDEAWR